MTWNYEPYADGDFSDLQPGQVVHETFAVNIGNESSGWTEQDVTVTLARPADVAPVIPETAQTVSLAAGEGELASGTINFNDANWYDTHAVAATFVSTDGAGNAPLGTFTDNLASDTALGGTESAGGQIGWNYNVSDAALAAIPDGTVVHETFDVAVADGAAAHQQVILNLSHLPVAA